MARILIVDDAAFMRQFLKNMMLEMGWQVVAEASNGLEAISMYKQYRPDVVTMDITMPDMEGIEAVQEIIRMDPSAKIIMCSAMGQHRMVLKAIKAGAKDFLVKPFRRDRVVESVVNLLNRP
ncbi:MAG: response regulator with CheY-like receiver, AAA-type ATPase, and DNA-binding domain [Paenibacillus sp.]|jgi:two-component system chemotaxis response regulator CheY|nr:response regulator with CheY-like receiver, AAA-type ATPase, and DNA-binding domain [Paenibacillus sp.]